MAWFRKKRVALAEVAMMMAQGIAPLAVGAEDKSIHQIAVSEGVSLERFKFELLAFQLFVVGQIVNRERLERRLKDDETALLLDEFIQALIWRIGNIEGAESLPSAPTPKAKAKLVAKLKVRSEEYLELIVGEAPSFAEMPKLFAANCGLTESDILQVIARRLLLLRGNNLGKTLSGIKIIFYNSGPDED